MAFTTKILSWRSPPEYCRLSAQKKAYQRRVTGTPGPYPSYAPEFGVLYPLKAAMPECRMTLTFSD